jgi:hypothetical protein
MNSKRRFLYLPISLLAMAVVSGGTVACGKKPGSTNVTVDAPKGDTAAPGAPAAPAAPAAGAGTIKGKVAFTGTPPVMPELNREADPFCAKTKMKAEDVVVNSNNTLKNVAVTVAKGAPTVSAPAEAVLVEIDQSNCMYAPRTITGVFDQKIKIVNSDPILHNVHTYGGDKTLFNRAQPKGSPAIEKSFTKDDGEVIKFKCDVHPWMTGWLVQNDSGLSSVTGETGEFEIKNVPPGTYTIQAWQEKYGPKTVEVTVKANETAEANISYDGSEKAAYRYHEVHLSHMDHPHHH